jgi:hypothetical protein
VPPESPTRYTCSDGEFRAGDLDETEKGLAA